MDWFILDGLFLMVILVGYLVIHLKILVDQIISRLLAYLMAIEVIYIRLLKSLFPFLCVNILADDVDYVNWKKKFKI